MEAASAPLGAPAALKDGLLPAWAPYAAVAACAAVSVAVLLALGALSVALAMVLTVVLALLVVFAWSRAVEGRRRAVDRTMTLLIASAFGLALIPLLSLVFEVARRGIPGLSIEFLTSSARGFVGGGGAAHALVGTLVITGVAVAISVPIGIMAAIYLTEYGGRSRLRRALTFFVDVMTGIPSIVAGLFAYALFAIFFGPGIRIGVMGSVALSVLMIPIVIRTSEEVLKIVPNHLR
jgi:phosphate transport system permease protein